MNKKSCYRSIQDYNRDHIRNLLYWLIEEVRSACGDGDGIWYSEYYDIDDILEVFSKEELPHGWIIKKITFNNDCFLDVSPDYERCQEGLIITNDKKMFDERPSWQQVAISY